MRFSRTKPGAWLMGHGARFAFWGLGLLSPSIAMSVGGYLFSVLGPRFPKSRQMRENLQLIFPAWSNAEVDRCTKDIWRSFGENVAGVPHMASYVNGRMKDQLIIDWRFDPASLEGRPFITCGAHLGHWEFGNAIFGRTGRDCVVTYKQVHSKVLNVTLMSYRQLNGAQYVEKSTIPRQSVVAMKENKILHFTVDQRVEEGGPVSFFGLPAKASYFPMRLAMKFSCPILPVECIREGRDSFRIVIHEPIYANNSIRDEGEQAAAFAQQVYRRLESLISARPAQWFCLSRRWSKEERAEILSRRS
jgi:KDO2-lipid IV(A) lauroyltransferase